MELVERSGEVSALELGVRRAARGRGSCVGVEGPAGIGKTALVSVAQDRASAGGMTILRAKGGALERDFPYGVVRQLLERPARALPATLLTGAAELARPALGLAETESSGSAADQDSVAHGLYWLVCALAEQAPLMLSIDDAHLADDPSLRFLVHLVRRIEDLAVAVVVAGRSAGGSPMWDELMAVPEVGVVRPRLLSVAGTATVVHHHMGDDSTTAFASACQVASGGNPFLLHELLVAVSEDGLVGDDTNAARVSELRPPAVSRSVLLRIRKLPLEATTLARAVATLGESAGPAQVAALANLDVSGALALFDRLAEAEVLTNARPLRFVHPLIREAIDGDMGAGERSRLHFDAARLLAGEERSAETVAGHLQLVDARGDPWIVDVLRAAAAAARHAGVPATALRWLTRALEEGLDHYRAVLLRELGEAELLSGDTASAFDHLRTALGLAEDDDTAAEVTLLLAAAHETTMDQSGAVEVLGRGLDAHPGASVVLTTRMKALRTKCEVLTGVVDLEYRRQLERLDPSSDIDPSETMLLCTMAISLFQDGSAEEAARMARKGLAGTRIHNRATLMWPDSGAMAVLAMSDYYEEYSLAMQQALFRAQKSGQRNVFAELCSTAAYCYWIGGDVRQCEERARIAIDTNPYLSIVNPVALPYLCLARLERDDIEGAAAAFDQVDLDRFEALSAVFTPHVTMALLRLRRAQGRAGEAVDQLARWARIIPGWPSHLPCPYWRLQAAEALLDLGDTKWASVFIDEQLAEAERWGTAAARGVTRRVQGLAADGEQRIELLSQAASMLARSSAQLDHARTLVDLGAALGAAKRYPEAREVLRSGLELAASCGSVLLERAAHAELVATGARPRRLRWTGLDSLTPSERRICQLALTGLTNTQIAQSLFVTLSTVEKHLGHAYTKLGISGRQDLPEALGEPYSTARNGP